MAGGMSIAEVENMCGLSMDDVMNISKNNQSDVEKEASAIWQQLDHLAKTDKQAYDKFVSEQIEEGKKFFEKYPDGNVPPPQPKIPISKFWVETVVLNSDGSSTGIPRYFNICESETIDYTDDKNLNIYMSDLDNRQVDCVIHPSFMTRCLTDNLFMHDTVQMIFQTYTSDHKEKENVRHQYRHHPEPRKLVMKVPKHPSQKKEDKQDSAIDILSKVRHSDEAKKMLADEKNDIAQRLFSMYSQQEAPQKQSENENSKKKDPVKALQEDFLDQADKQVSAELQKKKPQIEEIKPKFSYTLEQNAAEDSFIAKIEIPSGVSVSDISLELEGDNKLLVTSDNVQPLEISLEHAVRNCSAKFIKSKNYLKVTLQ